MATLTPAMTLMALPRFAEGGRLMQTLFDTTVLTALALHYEGEV
ncbi:hypothetical protein LHJMPILO_01231 [Aeromonas veronii]